MVVPGQVLAGRYQARGKMGTGGFADIFLGVDLCTGKEVAIKAMSQKQPQGMGLKWESDVLAKIDGNFAPKLIHYSGGDLTELPYIVMELLKGEDVSEIRHRQSTTRLPLSVCVHLAKEMVELLEKLHTLGIIHRDIKPNNFMRKHRKDRKLFLIDFGIAKKIIDQTGQIRPERRNADFRGTTMYASVNAHLKKDLSKRDDLISTFYVFLDLLLGHVPWSEDAKAKQKDSVQEYKEKFMKRPDKIVKEDPVLSARPDQEKLINALARITKFLNNLTYEDVPDYAKLRKLFSDVGALAGEEEGGFQWDGPKTGGTGGYGRALAEEASQDAAAKTTFFTEQAKALGLGSTLLSPADHALMWGRIAKKLLNTESSDLLEGAKRQLLSELLDIAKRHNTFFLVDGLTDKEFVDLQLDAIHRVERALHRGVKRAKSSSSSSS